MKNEVNIALFASGSGTNVENIYNYFLNKENINISCVLCNKPDAYVLERAKKLGLDSLVFSREDFKNSNIIPNYLDSKSISLIILAGFLWLIPEHLINKYPNRIINIHPALLSKYGGKGMYGMAVHKAVFDNKEKQSGITIHYVNSNYDEGDIIFQKKINIETSDTPESIAQKVHSLEYEYFPKVIEDLVSNL
ncbi:phosphoribosylglycinamide formyltransferase [Bacteroidales bacterium OttesenSCG-928-I21]|nr:phosphoribosylglycinamide formyltransferase [Bacteroidales bacterium OttesenSCG-928-I21]